MTDQTLTDAMAEVQRAFKYRSSAITGADDIVLQAVATGQLVTLADRDAAVGAVLVEAMDCCKRVSALRDKQIKQGAEKPAHEVDVMQQVRWRAGKLQAEQFAEAILALHPDATAALERALTRAREEERALWQKNLRETFDAMCAMRDSINEHIPMPSLESDLLQGPENSVFCATVANAVVNAINQARALTRAREVKPLVWKKGIVDWAMPFPGMKYVACSTHPAGCWAWWLEGAEDTRTVERDEQAAKAAAQADYAARVTAALQPMGDGQ